MLSHFETETFYDAKSKIWSGQEFESVYNLNKSLGSIFFDELSKHPKSICQISDSEGTVLTNEDALLQAIRIAHYFESQGIKQSDIIGIVGSNTTYLMAVVLATIFHGATFHAINSNHDKDVINQLFSTTHPKIIFCDGNKYKKIQEATHQLDVKIFTLIDHLIDVPAVTDLLQPTIDEHKYLPAKLENGTEQTFAILCASGSTSFPKAITISHKSRFFETPLMFTDQDIHFVQSTLDWASALYSFTASIIYGFKRIISHHNFTPEYYLDVVDRHKVTFSLGSPNYLAQIINETNLNVEKLNSLRIYAFGGGKCTEQTQHKFQAMLKNGFIYNVYSFTEFEYKVSQNFHWNIKPNSVGTLAAGVQAKIIDDNGMMLGPGEIGEIYCRHDRKWLGYYKNKEATDAIYDKDHWFRTGDLGYFDEDNYLYIVERKKDMLKYNLITYYPNEIEKIIAEMPAVIDVCVCGIWNEKSGEAAAAAVIIRDGYHVTEQDIINYVRDHIIADHKQLYGGVMILKEFPRTANGKVNRSAIKNLFLQRLDDNVEN